MLLWTNQQIAARSCKSCVVWQWNEQGHHIDTFAGGRKLKRRGPPPCFYPAGCAKGTYSQPRALLRMNERAVMHWQECRATGHWPDDAIVRRNAGLLERAYQALREQREQVLHEYIKASITHR